MFEVDEYVFFRCTRGGQHSCGCQNILHTYRMSLCKIFSQGELGTCPQNFMFQRCIERCEKNCFVQGGLVKFTYGGHFLTRTKTEFFFYIEN
jgi:hypothetical protein